jgi:N utilization substance protein A
MSQEVLAVLDQMERERGIPKETLFSMIEAAILSATLKSHGPSRDLRVQFDRKGGSVKAFAKLTVVSAVRNTQEQISLSEARKKNPACMLGQTYEFEVTPSDMGRIAAQAVRQAIMQGIRGKEKEMIFSEYKDRAGDIVSGTVRRFVRSDVVLDLGRFEGTMPVSERVPTEEYQIGDRIRALVLKVDMTARGPQIILSRSSPDFVRRLLELECNELVNGTVEIAALAREPGFRTKIAVRSRQEKVDPVGACVGIRGARVKNIVRELNSERVDIFKWSENLRDLIVEALKPAKLKSIEMDEAGKRALVVVDEENLALAIGKRGQNARLTQKLTGWEVDIRRDTTAEQQFQDKVVAAARDLAERLDLDGDVALTLAKSGATTAEAVLEFGDEDLAEIISDQVVLDAVRTARDKLKAANSAVSTPDSQENS